MHVYVCVCVRENRFKSKSETENLIKHLIKILQSKQLHVSVATNICTLEDRLLDILPLSVL